MEKKVEVKDKPKAEPKRTVHAKYRGTEVVRYGSDWFFETPTLPERRRYPWDNLPQEPVKPPSEPKKKQVSLEEAATKAAQGVRAAWVPSARLSGNGFQIFFGRGSKKFDELVRAICPELYIEKQEVDLGDGHKFWIMRCPGCRDWMQVDNDQLKGDACTDHRRSEGGCGFHGYTFGYMGAYVVDLGDVLSGKKRSDKKEMKVAA